MLGLGGDAGPGKVPKHLWVLYQTSPALPNHLRWQLANESFVTKSEASLRGGGPDSPKVQPKKCTTRLAAAALPTRSQRSAMMRRGLQVAARPSHHGALPGGPYILPTFSPASAFGSSMDSLVSECPTQPDGQPFSWGPRV